MTEDNKYAYSSTTTIILVSGGFDPMHKGHLMMFLNAKKLAQKLIVAVNSDQWLIRKKGYRLLPFSHRAAIIANLACVDEVIAFDDTDNTACNAIELVKYNYPDSRIVFANGGDRNKNTLPPAETDICAKLGVEVRFGIGGDDKAGSSSILFEEAMIQFHANGKQIIRDSLEDHLAKIEAQLG